MYVASLRQLSHVDQSLIDVKYVTLARWRYIALAFSVVLMVRCWYAMDLGRNVPTNRVLAMPRPFTALFRLEGQHNKYSPFTRGSARERCASLSIEWNWSR
jgi:hypothetical protein